MKKIIVLWLCLVMIVSLFSCDMIRDQNDGGGDGDEDSAVYDGVIDTYRSIIDICSAYVDEADANKDYAAEMGIVDEAEKLRFKELWSSAYLFYPGRGAEDAHSPHYKLSCGYAVKDLNGDGVDELVLLNDDYTVVAVFSCVDGTPVMLGNYIPRGYCWIDGDGLLHEDGSGGAGISTHRVYKIADGGASLELIAEYGTDVAHRSGCELMIECYKTFDGERVSISQDEYSALEEQYGKYSGSSGSEATKEYSGVAFSPLFNEADICSVNALSGE